MPFFIQPFAKGFNLLSMNERSEQLRLQKGLEANGIGSLLFNNSNHLGRQLHNLPIEMSN